VQAACTRSSRPLKFVESRQANRFHQGPSLAPVGEAAFLAADPVLVAETLCLEEKRIVAPLTTTPLFWQAPPAAALKAGALSTYARGARSQTCRMLHR
jgi:hypothetical protein